MLAACGLVGCAAPTDPSVPDGASAAPARVEELSLPLHVAVVGDSNTTGFKTTLADGIDAGTSWIALVPQSEIKYAGGWARNGATSTAMRDNVVALAGADVVVIMAGTNNIATGLPDETLVADLEAIAGTVGAAHTVISAIAPFDARADEAVVLNARLASIAASHDWTFVDPWQDLRTTDGKWMDIYRSDGLHTTPDGYQTMALSMRDQLVAAFGPGAAPAPTP